MAADPADVVRHSNPLARVVLCCTAIAHEARVEAAKRAQDMGAKHVMDLTSEVTHLICSEIGTPKYKYVAKMRADVKVMRVEWINAMYDLWIKGDDFDVTAFEPEFRLPTFVGLSISLTGIPDVDERRHIEGRVRAQGASYHADLTRQVSHLVAAAPTGKKYDFARAQNICVVSPEWLYDSLQRGMALEETYYHPTLPREKIGVGAKPAPIVAPKQVAEYRGKRKLRKKAEERLGSQSQNLWNDIVGQVAAARPVKKNEWEDNAPADLGKEEAGTSGGERERTLDELIREPGMFADCCFLVHGFEGKNEKTLYMVLQSHAGQIVHAVKALQESARARRFSITPHHVQRRDCAEMPPGVATVTEWWVEACLHKKRLLEPEEYPLAAPFEDFPLDGFKGLEICLTQFSGVELLHYEKLIGILGGTHHETLNRKRSLLVTNSTAEGAGGAKLYFAVDNNIPIVTVSWLQECVKQSRKVPYDDFTVTRRKKVSPPPEERADVAEDNSKNNNQVPRQPEGAESRDRDKGRGKDKATTAATTKPKLVLGDRFKRKSDAKDTATAARAKRRRSDAPGAETPEKDVHVHVLGGGGEGKGNEPNESGSGGAGGTDKTDFSKGSERDDVLSGCVVCVSKRLKNRVDELKALALSLGATVVESFSNSDTNSLTHLVHESATSMPRDTPKQVKAARSIPGCVVVSPEWLYVCRRAGKRVSEGGFPPVQQPQKEGQAPPHAGPTTITATTATTTTTGHHHTPPTTCLAGKSDAPPLSLPPPPPPAPLSHPSAPTPASVDREASSSTLSSVPPSAPLSDLSNFRAPPRPQPRQRKPSHHAPASSSDHAIADILHKFGKEKLASALDGPRKPRARLQGRATPGMPSLGSSLGSLGSRTSQEGAAERTEGEQRDGSAEVQQQRERGWSADLLQRPAPTAAAATQDEEARADGGRHVGVLRAGPPVMSQAIGYADPEAEREKRQVRARLGAEWGECAVEARIEAEAEADARAEETQAEEKEVQAEEAKKKKKGARKTKEKTPAKKGKAADAAAVPAARPRRSKRKKAAEVVDLDAY